MVPWVLLPSRISPNNSVQRGFVSLGGSRSSSSIMPSRNTARQYVGSLPQTRNKQIINVGMSPTEPSATSATQTTLVSAPSCLHLPCRAAEALADADSLPLPVAADDQEPEAIRLGGTAAGRWPSRPPRPARLPAAAANLAATPTKPR